MQLKKVYPVVLAFMLVAVACGPNEKKVEKDEKQTSIPIVDFSGIEPLLAYENDTTYIINFWATWCAPCVKELPYLEQIANDYKDEKLKVILVNLDFPSHYETRLLPFIEQNQISSKVIMLDDPDANSWINKVDPSWSGSIPATLVYNKWKREFFEKEFSQSELEEIVKQYIN
jgi:thiol-disulfide isomerase/thioredoxin